MNLGEDWSTAKVRKESKDAPSAAGSHCIRSIAKEEMLKGRVISFMHPGDNGHQGSVFGSVQEDTVVYRVFFFL